MNATEEMTRRLDVAAYVDEVRAGLADLAGDDREDLVDGLEADLTERLLETDPGASPERVLGPPAAYAAELRAAAGFPSVPTRGRRDWGRATERVRERLVAAGERPAVRALAEFLVAMRPAWWVIRAWIALQVADLWFGGWPSSWMISVDGYFWGGLILLAAIAVSVQIGRGAWWPDSERSPWPRRLLWGLNAFAVAAIPFVLGSMPTTQSGGYDVGWARDPGRFADNGLRVDGRPVHNVYAYDAAGKPVLGVQLFDADGKPIAVSDYRSREGRSWGSYYVAYAWPWTMSEADDSTNVFPIPVKKQPDRGFEQHPFGGDDPATPRLPFDRVPALSAEARDEIARAMSGLGLAPAAEPTERPGDAGDKADKQGRDGRATIGR